MVNSGISEENKKENLLKIGYKNLQQDNPSETLPEAEKVRKYGFSFTDGKEGKLLLFCGINIIQSIPDFGIFRDFGIFGFIDFRVSGFHFFEALSRYSILIDIFVG